MSNEQKNNLNGSFVKNFAETYGLVIGLVFAIVYGVGWLIQYKVNLQLGVGPISPTRESAIASGFALALYLGPFIIGPFKLIKASKNLQGKWPYIEPSHILPSIIGLLLYYFVLAINTIDYDSFPFSWSAFLLLALGLLLILFAVPLVLLLLRDDNPIAALQLISMVSLYTSFVAPNLSPTFGGYPLTKIEVTSDSKDLNGKWLLITADSEIVVIARLNRKSDLWRVKHSDKSKDLKIFRVPWSEIKMISSVADGK